MNKTITLIWTFVIIFNLFVFSQNNLENKYDVKQYILDLNISNSSALISGNITINSIVTASSLDTFVVDLINTVVVGQTYMIVDSIYFDGVINTFQHSNDFILVPLSVPIYQNQLFKVQIFYHGKGTPNSLTEYNGIYVNNYAGIIHTCTFSQPSSSKVWWPCKQDLTDKADSMTFYITTDSTNKSGSNGILKSIDYLQNGKVKYEWKTTHPIDFYLICFTVGPFTENITYAHLPNTQDSVLLQSLLFPNSTYYQTHLNAINKTKQLIYLYSELIGTYPFKDEKYGYCVVGNPLIAMEHQTMCTISYQALDTTAINYYGSDLWYFTAHELAHQWFGNYVTCASWKYMWVNEGFSTYMEYVALQYMETQLRADYWIQNAHNEVKSLPNGSVAISDSLENNSSVIFDYRLQYKKGASILHTLRYEINNDSLFFAVLRNYLSLYANSVATVENFKQVVETNTGTGFSDFFNQWYYGEGYPIFNINWSQNNDSLTIFSNQTTSTTITPLFKTHFDLKINYLSGDTTIRLYQSANNEIYQIYFPFTITSLEIDPNFWLIQNCLITNEIRKTNNTSIFSIFPNPAKNTITIELEKATGIQSDYLFIYNAQGQLMLQQRIIKIITEIDISKLIEGLYIVKHSNSNAILKFVKG